MFAKRFFFVSAGLLCLAAAYHLGSTTATAAKPTGPVVGDIGSTCTLEMYAIVLDRTPYIANNTGPGITAPYTLPPIPGSSAVVTFDPCTQNAILADGSVYNWTGTSWLVKGNLLTP